MTEKTIEELRLEALRIGMAFDGTLSERLTAATKLMALMENGPDVTVSAPIAVSLPALKDAEERRETVAQAIKAARDDTKVAPPAPPGTPRGDLLFSDQRRDLIAKTVHDARTIGAKPNWNTLTTAVNALAGATVTPAQVQKWWQNHSYRMRGGAAA